MKLLGIFLICYLLQGINSQLLDDLQKSIGSITEGLRNIAAQLLGKRSSGCGLSNGTGKIGGRFAFLTSSVTLIKLDTIHSSLQQVFADVDNVVQFVDPLSRLSSLSTSVNSAFKTISSTCRVVVQEVGGNIGSIESVLNGVNSALSNLINIIVGATSGIVSELSRAIDDSLDKIIRTFIELVGSVNTILQSIEKIASGVVSSLQAILKTTIIVTFKSLSTVSTNLNELTLFVPPKLAHIIKILSEQIADIELPNVSAAIDVDAIVRELRKCSEGTVVDVEIVSSSLDDSCNDLDVVVSAISTCTPNDTDWQSLFDDLLATISKSFDEVLYVIEYATKATLDWNGIINPVVMNVLFVIQDLISAARLTSRGNGEKMEPAIVNIAVAVQSICNGVNSVTIAANGQSTTNELASNALTSIELSIQSVISIVYDVFFAIALVIEPYISPTSVLPPLTTLLEAAIHASPATLINLIPSINGIVNNCNTSL